jgi:phospholipase C
MFGAYGVRVPALLVSPWIERRTVSHTIFDHTAIIKTILTRFCPATLSGPAPSKRRTRLSPQHPGKRVIESHHLGELLTRTTPRPAPSREPLLEQAAARAARAETGRRPNQEKPGNEQLNDLQRAILRATRELRRRGHPPNTP